MDLVVHVQGLVNMTEKEIKLLGYFLTKFEKEYHPDDSNHAKFVTIRYLCRLEIENIRSQKCNQLSIF